MKLKSGGRKRVKCITLPWPRNCTFCAGVVREFCICRELRKIMLCIVFLTSCFRRRPSGRERRKTRIRWLVFVRYFSIEVPGITAS